MLAWVSQTLCSTNDDILEDESLYTAIIESEQKIPNQIPEIFLFTVLVQKVYFISLINEFFSFKRQKIYFRPMSIIKPWNIKSTLVQ